MSSELSPPRRFGLRPVLLILASLLVAGLVLGLAPGRPHTALEDSFQTVGHFGFFALVAMVLALASGWLHPAIRNRRSLQYACGLAGAIVAGGLLEFAQKFIPLRQPSWNDLMFDSLGGVAGISLLIALDRYRACGVGERLFRYAALLIFLLAVSFGVWPFVSCARDYWQRQQAYPQLLKFTPNWIDRFLWRDDCVDVRPGELPENWPRDAGHDVAAIWIHPAEPFPGMGIYEPYPNWGKNDTFAFDIVNPSSAPLDIGLRIQDFGHTEQYYDRFNRVVQLQPGFQTVRIATADIERGPRARRLNLSHIQSVKLFLIRPTETVRLYVGNFRLE